MTELRLQQDILEYRNNIIDKCLREVGSINDKYTNFPREDWSPSDERVYAVLSELEEKIRLLKI